MTQLTENFWVPRVAAGTPLIRKASLLTRTLGKKDFDAGGGGHLADSRARAWWTSSSFLWALFFGFATVPSFGDCDAVQLIMFRLVMADAAASPSYQLKKRHEDADFASKCRTCSGRIALPSLEHLCGILVIWHGPFPERTRGLTG